MTKISALIFVLYFSIQACFANSFSNTLWETHPKDENTKITLEIFDNLSWKMFFYKTKGSISGHRIALPIDYACNKDYLELYFDSSVLTLIIRNHETLYFNGELFIKISNEENS